MTDDDRPTLPVPIDAAGSDRHDIHDRETIPAPEPEPEPARSASAEPASKRAPSPPLALHASEERAALELEPRGERERERETAPDADTWRPPPPPPRPAVENSAAPRRAENAASSLAPREVAQRTAPASGGQRRIAGLAVTVVLLGLGVVAVHRADRAARERAVAAEQAASTAHAAAPRAREALDPPSSPAPAAPAIAATPEPAPATAPATEPIGEQAANTEPSGTAAPLALAATADRADVTTKAAARRRAARRELDPAAVGELPETPTRESIAMSLQDLRDAISLCSAGRNGVAELDLTIRGNGTLAHALVGGDFGGTPQGSCIARTLRKARFAPFQREKFRVLYRLML